MSLTLIPVLIRAVRANGETVAAARVRAVLTVQETDNGVVVPDNVEGSTDASGECVLNLWPNSRGVNGSNYRVVVDGEKVYFTGIITVSEVPSTAWPVLIDSLINQPPYPARSVAESAQIAASAAAVQVAADKAVVTAARDQVVPAAAAVATDKEIIEGAKTTTVDAMNVTLAAGSIEFSEALWSVLVTREASTLGKGGTVRGDKGSHVDPVKVGGQVVPNEGVFAYRGPGLWEWLSPLPVGKDAFDALAGDSPAGVPQLLESVDSDDSAVGVMLDADGRVIAQFPDPAVAKLEARAMSTDIVEDVEGSEGEAVLLDGDGRVLARLASAQSVEDLQAMLAALGVGVEVAPIETLDPYVMLLIDLDGRILFSTQEDEVKTGGDVEDEVRAARGSQASLADRIGRQHFASGDARTPTAWASRLREVRMRLLKRRLGESTQLVIALIGDSYTQNYSRYALPFAKLLQDAYGFAGLGFISFGWYGTASGTWTDSSQPTGKDVTARNDLLTIHRLIGTWTTSYNQAALNTPSLSCATSSTPGDYIRLTIPAGHDAATLFYTGDGSGVIAISYDDGASYGADIPLPTVGAAHMALAGVPAVAAILRIKVVSGNVSLGGLDLKSSAPGVRVHKLGGSGSQAAQWANANAMAWGAQMLALGSHVHQVFHGTNDQTSGYSPASFASSIQAIFAKLNSVLPASDRLVVMPAENQRTTNSVGMPAYSEAARAMAFGNDCAFLDLQDYFGPPDNHAYAYAYANPDRKWYAPDLIHPEPTTGGRVIVDPLHRFYTQSL